jgi:hypothetical protein
LPSEKIIAEMIQESKDGFTLCKSEVRSINVGGLEKKKTICCLGFAKFGCNKTKKVEGNPCK